MESSRPCSLAPLASLRGLRFLHLANLKPKDDSLAPLTKLRDLEELSCAGFYPWQEFARLARALPSTECSWFQAASEVSYAPCNHCGAQSVMLAHSRASKNCLGGTYNVLA